MARDSGVVYVSRRKFRVDGKGVTRNHIGHGAESASEVHGYGINNVGNPTLK